VERLATLLSLVSVDTVGTVEKVDIQHLVVQVDTVGLLLSLVQAGTVGHLGIRLSLEIVATAVRQDTQHILVHRELVVIQHLAGQVVILVRVERVATVAQAATPHSLVRVDIVVHQDTRLILGQVARLVIALLVDRLDLVDTVVLGRAGTAGTLDSAGRLRAVV
jgi:hypothetical protein